MRQKKIDRSKIAGKLRLISVLSESASDVIAETSHCDTCEIDSELATIRKIIKELDEEVGYKDEDFNGH